MVRNIRDSRLVKLIDYLTRFSLTAEIKLNGRPISPLLTFLILVFGIAFSIRIVYKYVAKPLVYPVLRHLFYRLVRKPSKLLPPVKNLSQITAKATSDQDESSIKWVLIYGATNNLGTQVAKVFASHGYALVLVDGNLSKLQQLQ